MLRSLAECAATTDDAGAFVLRGPPPEFDCELTAVRATYVAHPPTPFALGTTDVVLRLNRSATFAASFTFEGRPQPFDVDQGVSLVESMSSRLDECRREALRCSREHGRSAEQSADELARFLQSHRAHEQSR